MNGSKECACVECLFFQTTDPILVFCCFLITRHVLMQHYYTHTDTDLSSLTLKCYYDQKITFIFSSDFETLFIKHSASEIISLNFEKKTVNLNCNFPF